MPGDPWYRDGLRFGCTRCGRCCVGHGTVRVTDAEIEALAAHLGLAEAEFRVGYTRPLRGGEVSLRERRDGACVFYEPGRGCGVYGERPRQCRTWPFWRAVVHSPERWAEEASSCPGMNRGERHPREAIERCSAGDGTSGRVPPLRG
jgi:uncharacterized protein